MNTVLHIGYHKTASTTLQRDFFPKLEGCLYLSHGGAASRSLFRALSEHLMFADDEDYLGETVRSYLAELHERSPGTVLLSHEGFSGAVFDGATNSDRNAHRLADVAPDAKMIIVVREQAAMLRSLYSQHLRHGGYSTFPEFLHSSVPGSDTIDLDHLCFDRLVELYHKLFGAARVTVLAFEDLGREPDLFLRGLADFIGVPAPRVEHLARIGPSLSPPSRWLIRHTNRMFWRTRINPEPTVAPLRTAEELARVLHARVDPKLFPRARKTLSDDDEAELARTVERYAASNSRLAELTGLSLADHGYVLER